MDVDNHTDKDIMDFYNFKNIAVVGMSSNEEKAAHFVPNYLIQKGYKVIPVNPNSDNILGRKCYDMVSEIKEEVDIVNIFRKSEEVFPVVKDLLTKGKIKLIWLQKDIFDESSMKLAKENGIDFVYNRCMMEEHERLIKK
jgi:predicted CoA-binding protein